MKVLYFFSALIFCLAFLVSDHYPPWGGYYNELGVALAFVLLVFAVLVGSPRRVVVPVESLFFGALALIPFLQLGFGLVYFSGSAWVVFLYLSSVAIAVIVGRAWRERGSMAFPQFFFCAILVAAVCSAFLAIYQALGLDFLGNWVEYVPAGRRSVGNLAQPNQLATLLLVGLVALVYALERQLLSRYFTAALLVLFAIALMATRSRSGLLGCIWLLVWFFILSRRQGLRISIGWLAGFSLLVGLGVFYFDQIIGPIADYLGHKASVRSEIENSRLEAGTRPAHWAILIDAVSAKPWFGYGWDQVSVAHSSLALSHEAVPEWQRYSHNIMLDLLVWCGVPLGVGVVGSCFFWVWRRLRGAPDVVEIFLLAALGCLFVHSMLEYPYAYIYFLIPAGCAIGCLSKNSYAVSVSRSVLAGCSFLIFCVLGVVVVDYSRVESNFRDLRMQHARIGMLEIDREVPALLLLDQLEGVLFAGRVEVREGMPSGDLDRLMAVLLRYPYPPVLLNAASAFALNGRGGDAAFALELLCRRHHPAICVWALETWRATARDEPALRAVNVPDISVK